MTCPCQFLSMAFAQLTYRESLRDIETCLGVLGTKLYHLGFGGRISRSTLAHANQLRDWRIFDSATSQRLPFRESPIGSSAYANSTAIAISGNPQPDENGRHLTGHS
jgi:hypothetical protein